LDPAGNGLGRIDALRDCGRGHAAEGDEDEGESHRAETANDPIILRPGGPIDARD
jgi:hypothetical protein